MNYSVSQTKWIWKYMPIIVQCEKDIDEGYGLVAVFYHYRPIDKSMEFHYVFKVCLVISSHEGRVGVFEDNVPATQPTSIVLLHDFQPSKVQTDS